MSSQGRQVDACEFCGRTILKGERTREYVAPGGERRAVCDLCRARVDAAGWVPADRAGEQAGLSREARGRVARDWIAERAKRVRSRIEEARPPSAPGAPGPEREQRGRPDSPQRRLHRALEEFNGSEHRRTVAGLTRSLGSPRVSAVLPPDAPHDVRLTVAWDLSWYQWEVRLADQPARVRSLARGSEIEQLSERDRTWNASVGEDGELRLGRNGSA